MLGERSTTEIHKTEKSKGVDKLKKDANSQLHEKSKSNDANNLKVKAWSQFDDNVYNNEESKKNKGRRDISPDESLIDYREGRSRRKIMSFDKGSESAPKK